MPYYTFKSPIAGGADLILNKRRSDYQLILRRPDGTTVRGQWLLHVKVSPELCSYDGRYFVYHYMSFRDFKSYTVLSTAPYFTAHILWSEIGKWTGGGLLNDGILYLRKGSHERYLKGELPSNLKLVTDAEFSPNTLFLTTHDTSEFLGNKFSTYNREKTLAANEDARSESAEVPCAA